MFEFASVGRRHANVCSTRFFNFSKCELSKTNLIRGISNLWVDGTHAAGNVYPTKIFNFPKCELICSSLSNPKLWVALDRWHACKPLAKSVQPILQLRHEVAACQTAVIQTKPATIMFYMFICFNCHIYTYYTWYTMFQNCHMNVPYVL